MELLGARSNFRSVVRLISKAHFTTDVSQTDIHFTTAALECGFRIEPKMMKRKQWNDFKTAKNVERSH